VLGFINELQRVELGAGTVRNVRDVMRLVLSLAVKSGSLKANPVTDIPVSRTGRKEMVFLEPDQIMTLAAEVGTPPARYRRGERRRDGYPDYGLLVRFAGFTGLRAGELVALRLKRLDLAAGSRCASQPPRRTGRCRSWRRRPTRAAPSPSPSRSPTSSPSTSPVCNRTTSSGGARRADRSATRIGSSGISSRPSSASLCPPRLGSTTSRHSYAAMLIAQGAHPRAIMERMGHSTITVTLDTYGHLFPKLDAALDDALDGMYRASGPRNGGLLVPLPR